MRETIFESLHHTPDRSLAPLVGERLSPYLTEGSAYTLVHETRDGMLYRVLLDLGARVAVQVWDPAAEDAAPVPDAPAPQRTIAPELDADSETDTVAAWLLARGLQGAVVGAWLWVSDSMPNRITAGGEDGAELRELLQANGFRFSKRRSSYFHMCGVRPKSERPTGRKLDAMHNVVTVDQYRPATYDPRPAWKQRKTRKKRAA